MLHETDHYDAGKLTFRDVYDDTAQTFTRFDALGAVVSQRAMTAAEISFFQAQSAAQTAQDQFVANSTTNGPTIISRAQSALTANATFQALASPTQAQTLAQVQLLTKECNGLIRLVLNLLDSTAGT